VNKDRDNLINFLENRCIEYKLNSDGEVTEIHDSLDLQHYEHDFIAPNLISIGGYLDLRNYNYKFNAPNLKVIGYSLYLYEYNHDFNAPSLKSIEGPLDLEDYKHEFTAPNLKSISGGLYLRDYDHEFTAPNLKSIGGGLYLCEYNYEFTAPLLEYIDYVYLENDKTYNLCGKEYKGINIDGITSILISEKVSKEGYTIKKCRRPKFEDKELIGDIHYIVSKDNVHSHGSSIKEAMKDYSFKLQKREGAEKYKEMTLETIKPLDYWITCYRIITGACKYGVNEFLNSISKKETYSLKEVMELTENQYGHESFKGFFK
jgi:hypothetical protein